MCYKKIYSAILVCLVLLTIVQGSCLEYGHSCWGAHGKRSGAAKIYHGDANILADNINNNKNIDENAALSNKILFENFDILNAPADRGSPSSDEQTPDALATAPDVNDNAVKLKNLLRKHNSRFRPTRNQNTDLSTEQQERKATHHHHHAERWRKIPLFHLKNFAKAPLNVAAAENDLLQQLERQETAASSADEAEGVFYDFK